MSSSVERVMSALKCDEQTALSILADDARIDKGEKLFELTQEQEKASKKYRQVGRAPTIYNFTKRERKADQDKRDLIEMITATLTLATQNEVDVTNIEKQIDFEFRGRKFRVVLSAPRS